MERIGELIILYAVCKICILVRGVLFTNTSHKNYVMRENLIQDIRKMY